MLLLTACLPLAGAEEDGTENRLVLCEYEIFGGMENESFEMTLTAGDEADVLLVRERQWSWLPIKVEKVYEASRWALRDLETLLAAYHPQAWAGLPYSELQALDAPTHAITVRYSDGTEYYISDSKEIGGPLFWEVRCFLDSYSVTAETATLTFSSFDGGGPDFSLTLDAPEKVDWYRQNQYDSPQEPQPPGSGYTVSYVFRGRIPGDAIATVCVNSPLSANHEGDHSWDLVYILRIDNDYNVAVILQEKD